MKIEKTIIDAVELSKATDIPVLFMSNPGLGKTTILKRYASRNGLHLETLIGSRFSPEEISGYLVNNGGDALTHMSPDWFARIWQKADEGITSLLFIDELSTCSEAVQGSLLSLIFDRVIGGGKKLPEDCLIVAAANYARNLSCSMNMLSPTLNRFCIINLNDDYTALEMIDEFLTPPEPYEPEYKQNPLSEEGRAQFNENFRIFWKETFIKYSDPDASIGVLDISNKEFENMYTDSTAGVYNFISGRTLSYLQRMLAAYIELGMDNQDLIGKLTDGLVGGGTYSFKEEKQAARFRAHVGKASSRLVHFKVKKTRRLPKLTGNISQDISAYLMLKEDVNLSPSDEITFIMDITEEIEKGFTIEKLMEQTATSEGASQFISDFEELLELQHFVSNYPDTENLIHRITRIGMDFYALYCEAVGTKPDFQKAFGLVSPHFRQTCFIRRNSRNTNAKPEELRGALRIRDRMTNPSLYEIPDGGSLAEANLMNVIHQDGGMTILIFDNGLKYIPVEEYMKRQLEAAA